jgi:hypothetical protein
VVVMTQSASRRRAASSSSARSDGPDVVEQLKELKGRAADVAGAVRASAGSAAGQMKKKAGEMTRAVTGTIKEEAERLFDEQKGKAASKVARYGKVIHQAAHALRAVKAEGLAEYVDSAGVKVEGLTDYLEERNLTQVLQDAGEVARRHPGLTIGGMFLTGLALARFLKASAERDESDDGSGEDEEKSGERGSSREKRRSN